MTQITETLRGIVSRITYHNPDNGWSVLRVQAFDHMQEQVTVTVHQTKVFAGATMEFHAPGPSIPSSVGSSRPTRRSRRNRRRRRRWRNISVPA